MPGFAGRLTLAAKIMKNDIIVLVPFWGWPVEDIAMSQVAKVIELVGTSDRGWQDAVEVALAQAAKTIRHITGVEVTHMTAEVQDQRITQWRVTVKIAFGIEGERPQ